MVLIEELERNIDWYRGKGKTYKRLSFIVRMLYLGLFTASLACMALIGAGVATVILGILGGAVFLIDRTFNITRNWVEFSYLEVSLSGAVAVMRFHKERGDTEAMLEHFNLAIKKVENETLGWQADVTQGIRELKGLFETNVRPAQK
ncbi:hypothetical protein [Martelella sp. AD-3]|uniref:hypothetical protein n=1 Tax=Martelella sp. AD-3 TaxID=686597 RepID=UPI00046753DD|nr:hypothetical protein [Martelella sp. AD-3]AMM84226.1 hypothetical protein AZF01_07530 [Martelella sp. AD-3]